MDAKRVRVRRDRWAGLLIAGIAAGAPAHALEVGPPLEFGVGIDGAVSTVLALPGGRIVIGGAFKQVRGLRSDGIAMLEPDGSGVPGFAPQCRGPASTDAPAACAISRIVSTGDGALIVAGSFAGFGTVARDRLAKLDATTGAADPAWNPFAWIAPAPIVDIAVFDGKVVLVLGGPNPRIATVALAGTGLPVADAPTIPLPGWPVTLAPPGHAYFASGPSNGRRVRRLRLDSGEVDPGWQSREFQSVESIAWEPAGRSVLIAGSEPFAGNLLGRILVRVQSTADAPEWPAWNPFHFTVSTFRAMLVANGFLFADACDAGQINCTVRRMPLAGNGTFDSGYSGSVPFGYLVLAAVDGAGRAFVTVRSGETPSPAPDGSRLVRLADTGSIDDSFRPRIRGDSGISSLAPSRSGDIVLLGGFSWIGDLRGDKFLRLRAGNDQLADWRPFGPTCSGTVCDSITGIAVDASNRLFIATKLFTDDLSPSAPSLRRYQPEGEPLESWHPARVIGTYNGSDARIHALLVDDANGWLYIGGRFEGEVCGEPRRNLARVTLAAPCRADPTWRPDPDATVESLLIDTEGRVVAGGAFRTVGGQPIPHLARFDGSVLDTLWRPLANELGAISVPKLAATPGFVFAEVRQSLPGSGPTTGLLRLSTTVSAPPIAWSPPPAAFIDALVGATNGRLFAVRRGVVPRPFAPPVDRIEVFDADGDGTPRANMPLAAGQRILAAAPRADGSILVGGRFDRLGGAERATLATIFLDPFALFASSFE